MGSGVHLASGQVNDFEKLINDLKKGVNDLETEEVPYNNHALEFYCRLLDN